MRTESNINRFVDLGSGGGKAVFIAYLTGIFYSCAGIELLPRLHKASKQYLRYFKRQILTGLEADEMTAEGRLLFIHGDFTFLDWSSGIVSKPGITERKHDKESKEERATTVVVFALSTCFDSNMTSRVANIANKMPTGSFFICTSQK